MAADRQMDWHIPLLSYTVLYCTLPPKKERDNAVTEQKIVEWKTQIYKNIPARRRNFQLIMQLILKPFQNRQTECREELDNWKVQSDRQIDKPSVGLILKPTGTQKD